MWAAGATKDHLGEFSVTIFNASVSAAQAQSENSVKNQTHNAIYSFIESHLFTSEDMLGEHEIMMTTTPMQGVYLLGP